jgi:hypothetical protein
LTSRIAEEENNLKTLTKELEEQQRLEVEQHGELEVLVLEISKFDLS